LPVVRSKRWTRFTPFGRHASNPTRRFGRIPANRSETPLAPRIVKAELIFWDPKAAGTRFGRKLDAIDTDQITPAADCVSESLDTLDERWKAARSAT
jgi:hypothetical protein